MVKYISLYAICNKLSITQSIIVRIARDNGIKAYKIKGKWKVKIKDYKRIKNVWLDDKERIR